MERGIRRFVVATFVVALVARGIELRRNGTWANPMQAEPTEEVTLAQSIAAGQGFNTPFQTGRQLTLSPSVHSPPLFPYLQGTLLTVGRATGMSANTPYRIALAILVIISSIAVSMVALGVLLQFGQVAGIVAAVLGALWLPIINASVLLWDTPLEVTAACAAAYLLVRADVVGRIRSWWLPVILGFGGGLAALANPAAVPVLGIAILVVAFQGPAKTRIRFIGTVLACGLITLSPWMIRNATVLGRPFLPIRGNFGLELWHGNRPGSDGSTQSTFEVAGNVEPNVSMVAQVGEVAYDKMREQEAKEIIRQDPRRFWRMTGHRVALFWLGRYTSVGGATPGPAWPLAKTLLNLAFVVCGLAGLFFLTGYARIGAICAVILAPIPYYVTHVDITGRFRVPLEPLLAVGVALTIRAAWQRLSRTDSVSA